MEQIIVIIGCLITVGTLGLAAYVDSCKIKSSSSTKISKEDLNRLEETLERR